MLSGECESWRSDARISPDLYARIRGQFNDNIIREVLLAAAGVKISRTCLDDAEIDILQRLAQPYGFQLLASRDRFIHQHDKGKGGWSNSIKRVARAEEEEGLRNVYIASDTHLAEAAKTLEETSDDQLFGTLLGIPACCIKAYGQFQPKAKTKQNDCVPLVLDNTLGTMPYDPWLNYTAQYFGRTLLSFFPCSFRCAAARRTASGTFEMLRQCDAVWASSFFELQKTNILYTEYLGIHLFRQQFVDGSIRYAADQVESTELTEVSALIQHGNRLDVHGKHRVGIYCGSKHIGKLEGEDVSMCVFW